MIIYINNATKKVIYPAGEVATVEIDTGSGWPGKRGRT